MFDYQTPGMRQFLRIGISEKKLQLGNTAQPRRNRKEVIQSPNRLHRPYSNFNQCFCLHNGFHEYTNDFHQTFSLSSLRLYDVFSLKVLVVFIYFSHLVPSANKLKMDKHDLAGTETADRKSVEAKELIISFSSW